jgi:hypothetical protein
MIVYTAIGAAVIWGKMGHKELRAYVLSDFVRMVPIRPNFQSILEFLVFVTLGCAVGIGVAQPVNARQALTAGIAWTSFFSTPQGTKTAPKNTEEP